MMDAQELIDMIEVEDYNNKCQVVLRIDGKEIEITDVKYDDSNGKVVIT